jgi:aryl-alcohol dehydrogenase-like predicted oxidoreductase
MEYRELGRSGIRVSAIAMGCWAIAGDWVWGTQDERDSLAAVHAALDAGINFFDTAEGYGDGVSEAVLGRALAGRRHEAVIATKVGDAHLAPADVRQACERSLSHLGTDYIDLYQIHWPSWTIPLAATMDVLESLRQEGKIRAIGVSNFGPLDLADLRAVGGCATNQLPYSLLWRAIEDAIQPLCVADGIGILCYSPLAQGLLTGKFSSADEVPETRQRTRYFSRERRLTRHGEAGCEEETFATVARVRAICARVGAPMADVALAWLLQRPGIVSVLAGARTADQVRENARGAGMQLSAEVMAELDAASDALKRQLGLNVDMYQSASRIR